METQEKVNYRSNFRRKVAQEVMAGLLTQQQASEKYRISVNLALHAASDNGSAGISAII
jgi:hypothetical protein